MPHLVDPWRDLREALFKIGYFDGRLSLEDMIELNPMNAKKVYMNEYYEVYTDKSNVSLDGILIPKNGTHYTMNRIGISYDEHHRFYRYQNNGQVFTNKNKKFVIIRDPVSRAISSYQEVIKIREDLPLSSAVTKKMNFFQIRENVTESFASFLEELYKYGFYDQHVYPQCKFLHDLQLSLDEIDYVILLEDAKEGIDKLCQENSITLNQSHEEAMSGPINCGLESIKDKIKNFLKENKNYRELLKFLYAKDFELYDKAKK